MLKINNRKTLIIFTLLWVFYTPASSQSAQEIFDLIALFKTKPSDAIEWIQERNLEYETTHDTIPKDMIVDSLTVFSFRCAIKLTSVNLSYLKIINVYITINQSPKMEFDQFKKIFDTYYQLKAIDCDGACILYHEDSTYYYIDDRWKVPQYYKTKWLYKIVMTNLIRNQDSLVVINYHELVPKKLVKVEEVPISKR